MSFDLNRLIRNNIRQLKPYSSARAELSREAKIFLDANENSFGSPLTKWYNRYPDPLQRELKRKISTIKKLEAENMFLGNGSDECIDLLIRAFCNPGQDSIIICPPTYDMYGVCARINDVVLKEVPLTPVFQLDLEALEETVDANTKLIFFCSPNDPTGNSISREDIEMVLNNFDGLVVVDEAFINYSRQRSFITELKDYPNLVVLQTFSKAWGLAALRLGVLFASREIVNVLNKIKLPYNISQATQELMLKALDNLEDVNTMIRETVNERSVLIKALEELPIVHKIFPPDANFILVRMNNAKAVYAHLIQSGIIVRDVSHLLHCEDSLCITIGTPQQNSRLVASLKEYK